jgi:hypothetical protein
MNILVNQRMIEGRIFIKFAAVNYANAVVDAVHTDFSRCDTDDGTVETMNLDPSSVFDFSPSCGQQPQAQIGYREMSIGNFPQTAASISPNLCYALRSSGNLVDHWSCSVILPAIVLQRLDDAFLYLLIRHTG